MFRASIRLVSISLICVFSGITALSQESTPKIMVSPKGDTIVINPVKLSQITSGIEESYNTIKKVEESLLKKGDLETFDSIYENSIKFLDSEEKTILDKKGKLTLLEIENYLKQWAGYRDKVSAWKNKIQNRVLAINTNLFQISVLKEKWLLTYKTSRASGVPNNVLTSVSELIVKLKKLEKDIKKQQNKVLDYQNKITKTSIIIDNTINNLSTYRSIIQSDYFRQDSPPFWSAGDSTLKMQSTRSLISQSFESYEKSVSIFLEDNKSRIVIHLFLFFIIWGILFLLNKKSGEFEEAEEYLMTGLAKTREIISSHAAAALIITLFLSIWLYPTMTSSVSSVIRLIFIVISIVFLPRFINKKIKPFLFIILLLFIINFFQIMIPGKTLFTRIVLLLENLLAAWVLYKIYQFTEKTSLEIKSGRWGFFVYLIPLFLFILAASFVTNLIGFVNIAQLMNSAVINAMISFIIMIMVVMVFISTFLILIRMPFVLKSNLLSNHFTLIEKRISQIIYFVGILLWVKSVLKSFSLYLIIYDWFTGLTEISWDVGKNATIDLGGIINFFLIIIITYYVTRFIKAILNEEVFPRIRLPRGVPGAITMITGYFIAGYGLFLAIGTVVDLGKFGLLAGTLGVGIGFGLQGIVANFIAGLVLAFERPIQVGDTIEVNNMMGDVVSIGVRSSTIRTFDGSEVIIPNSTLITNDVVNWTLSDRKKRRDIYVGVAYGTDPHQVLEIIKKVANDHPNVLKTPAPWALFDGFGDSALNFRLRIWTTMDTGLTTKSDVAIAIYDALEEAGIQIPFPQHDLHLKSIDPEIEKVAFRKTSTQPAKKTTPKTDKNKSSEDKNE